MKEIKTYQVGQELFRDVAKTASGHQNGKGKN